MFGQARAFCAVMALCIGAPALAAPDPATFKAQLDAFVEREMRDEKVPGVAIAVLRKARLSWRKAMAAPMSRTMFR